MLSAPATMVSGPMSSNAPLANSAGGGVAELDSTEMRNQIMESKTSKSNRHVITKDKDWMTNTTPAPTHAKDRFVVVADLNVNPGVQVSNLANGNVAQSVDGHAPSFGIFPFNPLESTSIGSVASSLAPNLHSPTNMTVALQLAKAIGHEMTDSPPWTTERNVDPSEIQYHTKSPLGLVSSDASSHQSITTAASHGPLATSTG